MEPPQRARPSDPNLDMCCGCLPSSLLPAWMRAIGDGLAHCGARGSSYAPPVVVSPSESFGTGGGIGSEDELNRLLPSNRVVGKLSQASQELEGFPGTIIVGNSSTKIRKLRTQGSTKFGDPKNQARRSSNSAGRGANDDDDDVCPTCLELYDGDNPKIFAACGHHFHLSCIYEWLERSRTCPVCLKPMEFDELS